MTKKYVLLLCLLTLPIVYCSSSTDQDLEKARFLLTEGQFDEAIALAESVLDAEPNNNEARFILGSALISNYALAPKPGCAESQTYLGALSCLLQDPDSEDVSGIQTFARIAPEDDSLNSDIYRAVEVLAEIDEFTADVPEKDVALQRLVARAFAISTMFQITGANSENVECNAGTPNTVDEIPDDFDSSLITTGDAERFQDNLIGIGVDAAAAGLNDDFAVFTRATAILEDIDAAQDAVPGTTLKTAVRAVFEAAYALPPKDTCI